MPTSSNRAVLLLERFFRSRFPSFKNNPPEHPRAYPRPRYLPRVVHRVPAGVEILFAPCSHRFIPFCFTSMNNLSPQGRRPSPRIQKCPQQYPEQCPQQCPEQCPQQCPQRREQRCTAALGSLFGTPVHRGFRAAARADSRPNGPAAAATRHDGWRCADGAHDVQVPVGVQSKNVSAIVRRSGIQVCYALAIPAGPPAGTGGGCCRRERAVRR